jgi:chromosome partitioning protein
MCHKSYPSPIKKVACSKRQPPSIPGTARKKMLLVDADAQGNLTDSFGWNEPDKLPVTLATIMSKIIMDEPIEPREGILHYAEGIDLMAANIEFSAM